MDRLKKLNGSMIAAIVLSVLLIMSITTGATLAWFASRDSATNSLTMGEAVVVTIGEDYKQGNGELAMNLPVDKATNGLLPGMSVTPNIKVQLQKSNTNALLRARFITSVEYPDLYEDEAFVNKKKYPNSFADTVDANKYEGRVLNEKARVVYKSADGNLPTADDTQASIALAKTGQGYDANGKPYRDAYGAFLYIDAPGNAVADYKYQVFAGYMIYDYYNELGQRLKSDMTTLVSKTESDAAEVEAVTKDPFSDANMTTTATAHTRIIHLNRVQVRDEIASKIGTNTPVVVNGVSMKVTEKNAAELEIRQRGVDLTNAINRVLQGQRGYKLGTDGKLYDDASGLKYTRRVADGWAYRDADQAWYYLGSQTNGFVITDNTDGNSEKVDTSKPIAKDITKYDPVKTGNVTVQQPTYKLLSAPQDENPYHTTVTTKGENNNDMTRNYLGGTSDDAFIDRVSNEVGVLKQATIASIDLSQGDVNIDFLTKRFVLPTFIDNSYAKAKVTFTFTVEAVQDYLIDPLQESTAAADRLPNNLVNAILVFNNAFPQILFPQNPATSENRLRATGCTVNVLPGGGQTVTWDNKETGSTTIVYNDSFSTEKDQSKIPSINITNKVDGKITLSSQVENDVIGAEGNQYSYGHLKDKTITDSLIKGFGVKQDEYGDYVADYKTEAAYVRGTASSIGVCPFKAASTPTNPPSGP